MTNPQTMRKPMLPISPIPQIKTCMELSEPSFSIICGRSSLLSVPWDGWMECRQSIDEWHG
ncbi:hypothetical protein [Synechococcus sp. M16CYN]|uniref:hypothetical protein n=1 Tax=Synechococcus sp. M16CYN TaxID=3103139 RepID=UPI00333EF8F5